MKKQIAVAGVSLALMLAAVAQAQIHTERAESVGVTGASASATPQAPAGSAVVTPANMPAFCRGEVAGAYGTRPTYVKTGPAAHGKDGSTSIAGTVDKGSEGIKRFACRFDAKGRFIDVMALTSDGE